MSKLTQNNVDTMVLCGGHSIMVSHLPKGLNPEKFNESFFKASKLNQESLDSFGLFGANTDYNTYYPEVEPGQFNPSEEEFIEPVFRMLSNCIVAKNYNPTEFPAKVLKDSMSLLVGQTINCDHETEIGNAIGSVKSVSWQNAYIDEETGVEVPGGINGVFRIDAKANPRIARGINMDPPSIHSNSVTVMFEWKPSHNFEKEWEFYDKLGTVAEDGTIVRRIATRIICYKETSLVSHGADPFAQIIKGGKINNPEYAGAVYYSFADMDPMDLSTLKTKFSYLDYKGVKEIDTMYNTSKSNNKGVSLNDHLINTKNKCMDKELQAFLDSLFGDSMLQLAEGEVPSMEMVSTRVKNLITENTSLSEAKTQLESEITSLKTENQSLRDEAEKNKGIIAIGTSHLSEVRNDTLASYNKLMGEKADQTIISLISSETTNLETLKSLRSSYETQLEEKFPMKCEECGSHKVSRASAIVTSENSNNEDTPKIESVGENIQRMAKAKI